MQRLATEEDKAAAARAVEVLNELYILDPTVLEKLIDHREACSPAYAEHPTVQVVTIDGIKQVGLLGVLNSLFGTHPNGYGLIAASYDAKSDKLQGFMLSSDATANIDPWTVRKVDPRAEEDGAA